MDKLENIKRDVASILIRIKAVSARSDTPYILTSGTLSPVYGDLRRLISYVEEREQIMDFLNKLVTQTVKIPIHGIAGGETAGIPYAAFLSDKMRLPMLYVRKNAKGFGRNAQVEGYLPENSHVVLIEDIIFNGGSKVVFINALKEAGYKIDHLFTIASYALNEQYEKLIGPLGVQVHWLTDWSTIADVGYEMDYFNKKTADLIKEFLKDPTAWSRSKGGK